MRLGKLWGFVLGGLALLIPSAVKADLVFLSFQPDAFNAGQQLHYQSGVGLSVNPSGQSDLTALFNGFTLNLQSGLIIPPASAAGQVGLTQITNTSLVLGPGFNTNGAATVNGIFDSQMLTGGHFAFNDSNGQLLLSGTAGAALITGPDGSMGLASGFLLSLNGITYDNAGVIGTALFANPGFAGNTPSQNSFSISALSINPPLSISGSGSSATLDTFDASITGQFRAAPMPASCWAGLTLLGGLGVVRRIRAGKTA